MEGTLHVQRFTVKSKVQQVRQSTKTMLKTYKRYRPLVEENITKANALQNLKAQSQERQLMPKWQAHSLLFS